MGKRAKRCRWQHEELFGFPICKGQGRGCNGLGRHQTARQWERVRRISERRIAGLHNWATIETERPF